MLSLVNESGQVLVQDEYKSRLMNFEERVQDSAFHGEQGHSSVLAKYLARWYHHVAIDCGGLSVTSYFRPREVPLAFSDMLGKEASHCPSDAQAQGAQKHAHAVLVYAGCFSFRASNGDHDLICFFALVG